MEGLSELRIPLNYKNLAPQVSYNYNGNVVFCHFVWQTSLKKQFRVLKYFGKVTFDSKGIQIIWLLYLNIFSDKLSLTACTA